MKTKIGILTNSSSEIIYVDYRGTSIQAPDGFEWAQNSLTNFHVGIQHLERCQRDVIGFSVLAEGFCRRGVFVITQDGIVSRNALGHFGVTKFQGNEGVNKLNLSSFLHRVPEKYRKEIATLDLVPMIALNDYYYGRYPQNAAFLLGHELGEFYNVPDQKLAEYTLVKILTGEEPHTTEFSMHSHNHLFGLGLQMDSVQGQRQGNIDGTLLFLTQRRTQTLSSPENMHYLPRELFADCVGIFFSEGKPDFPGNPHMKSQKFPIISPIAKSYVQTLLLLDAAYRSAGLTTPAEKRAYQVLYEKLFSHTGGLSRTDFDFANGVNIKLHHRESVSNAELVKVSEMIAAQITSFKSELKEIASQISGRPHS